MRVTPQKLWLCAVLSCLAGPLWAVSEVYAPPAFDHYQSILDRMPFGDLPAGFGAEAGKVVETKSEAQARVEQERLAKQVNMSAVNITPAGKTAIGFTDLSAKPPVNYYLLVGAESGGWKVLAADYDNGTATIEKEEVSITLKLGAGMVTEQPGKPSVAGNPVSAPPATTASTAPAAGGSTLPPGLIRRSRGLALGVVRDVDPPAKASAPAKTSSYVERHQERVLQRDKDEQAARAKMQANLAELARKAAANEIQRRVQEDAEARASEPLDRGEYQ